MSPAKTKVRKNKSTKSSAAKIGRAKSKVRKAQRKTSARRKPSRAKSASHSAPSRKARAGAAKTPKIAKPSASAARAFRFTAADVVQIQFADARKPERFRVDDMAEASLLTLDGATRIYYQFRLVAAEPNADTDERHFWFFDPSPVGDDDSIGPTLWTSISEQSLDELPAVRDHSGRFSTKSVTSYDGSGHRHTVRVTGRPTLRMRFAFNGHEEVCESLPVSVSARDVLVVQKP